ncbi:replicative DNA helicase [Paenibacillus sp. GP183]|uniref:replicative DNA helicase n=1 Tax=Paenibacillus sp. GP183 TaxID=1882751 RepID=UPI0008974131|nr:replicative DNA helicase [Paenibacillus sp. GP183]SEC18666.1 replicative DNA helicase [Paenibacillus sp. GP183]
MAKKSIASRKFSLCLEKCNIGAEQAVLGAILFDDENLGICLKVLKNSEYFYQVVHQKIYSAFLEMYCLNEPIDLVTATYFLENKNQLDDVGGVKYLSDLLESLPTAANIAYYVNIVNDKYLFRRANSTLENQIKQGFEANDPRAYIADIQEAANSLADEMHTHLGFKRVGEILNDHEEIIYQRQQQKGMTGASTCSMDLNKLTGGRQKKDLIIVAARPSVGKTAFVLNECLCATKTDSVDAALFISLEMHDISLSERLICMEGHIDASKLRSGMLGDLDWERYTAARSAIEHLPIFIHDSPGITVQEIDVRVKEFKKNFGPNIIVYIDFLQMIDGGKKFPNRETEIAFISRSLKQIARKYDCPVVAISSLGRGCEHRQDKRPMLSDLRVRIPADPDGDSGSIRTLNRKHPDTKPETSGHFVE